MNKFYNWLYKHAEEECEYIMELTKSFYIAKNSGNIIRMILILGNASLCMLEVSITCKIGILLNKIFNFE